MNMRPKKRGRLSVDVTPLIDVVFLLLIFFMVSTSFNRESDIVVDLPEASTKQLDPKANPVELIIDAQGLYYLNRQQLVNTQLSTLKIAITKAMEGDMSRSLMISADGKTPHQSVVTAMDAARQLGIVHLSIATKQVN